jgi:hypothetical protein
LSQVNLDKNNAYFLNLEEVLEDGYKLPKRKKYVMTWTNSRNKTAVEENIFEMPTGGAAIMKQGRCILLVRTMSSVR